MPYRRRRRRYSRSFSRRPVQSVTHNPGLINQTLQTGGQLAAIVANAGVSSAPRSDAIDRSSRASAVSPGSKVFRITTNLAAYFTVTNLDEFRSGILHWVAVRRTNSKLVPLATDLPAAEIATAGLQSVARQEFPGNVLHYGQMAVSGSNPATRKFAVSLGKYKKSKFRQGDFYVIYFYWQATGVNPQQTEINLDVQSLFKEYK